MQSIHIDKTTDKKFLVKSWAEKKEGTFVFETLDKVIEFIKEVYQQKEEHQRGKP